MINENRFKGIMEFYIDKIYDNSIIDEIENEEDLFICFNYSFHDINMVILRGYYKYIMFEHLDDDTKYYFKLNCEFIEDLKSSIIYKYLDITGFIAWEFMDNEEIFIHDIMKNILENLEPFHEKYNLR